MRNACIFFVVAGCCGWLLWLVAVAGCCGWMLLFAVAGCCYLLWLVVCCGWMLLFAVACCQLSASLTFGKYIGLGLGIIIYI